MAEPTAVSSELESPKDFGDDGAAVATRWISEITIAEKDQESWKARSRRIITRYRADQKEAATDVKQRQFALLWSNMQTLQPAVYARTPTAVVGRRWKDNDPLGRLASEIEERALNFLLDSLDFADVMTGLRNDYLLVARGQAWVRYVPHMKTVNPADGDPQQDAADGQVAEGQEPYEVVAWEEAIPDHVSWDDFLHNPARKWAEVRWVSRIAYLTRDEIIERFKDMIGEEACKAIPLDHSTAEGENSDNQDTQFGKATVYEIWDKPSRKAIWISKGYTDGPLDERDDPLGLQDFFPCPRPLLGTCGPDSLIPTPDYVYYQSQACDIDELTVRIGKLTDALKMKGFYAAGSQDGKNLADLLDSDTGTLIPVDSWAAFAEKGGVKGLIEWVPLDLVVATLKGCIEARQQLIQDVYQITGIADIMRGDVDPDETATATRTKANWGSSRVRDKQKELARFARDLLRIMGQIIASKFQPETLAGMSNMKLFPDQAAKQQAQQQVQMAQQQYQQLAQTAQQAGQQPPPPPQIPDQVTQMLQDPTWEEVTGLLRDNTLRGFRIEVETDSTIEPNDQDEKQRRIEFIQAVGEYVAKSIPAIQLMPQMTPVITEGLKFLVRGFRVGREMEEVIDRALEQLVQAGPPQQQQKPGPDPKIEQMKGQAAMIGAQAKMSDAQTNQFRAQTDRFEAQAGAQLDAQRIHVESQDASLDRQSDAHLQGQSIAADLQQSVVKAVERREIRDINSPAPITAPTQ